jgi:MEMO1 family protein
MQLAYSLNRRLKTILRPGLILSIGGLAMAFSNGNSFAGDVVRPPAVAWQFYTGDPSLLKKEVEGYIAHGPKKSAPPMLISPHAGFVFSGSVAGKGYSIIDKSIKTVILIGPSHHAGFSGLSISDADYYATPLGNVPLAKDIIAKLRKSPIVQFVPAADGPEHSLEVQLPFLQVVAPSVSIVPIITGDVEPEAVAQLLYPLMNATTLVIASSDLSHFHSSKEAKVIDGKTIQTILSGNVDGFLDACGETPIRIVMRLAAKSGLTPELLDARNSFETAPHYKMEDRVVGYASVGYFKKNGQK